jgi:hypothetical protein
MELTNKDITRLITTPAKELFAQWKEDAKNLLNAPRIRAEQRLWLALQKQ